MFIDADRLAVFRDTGAIEETEAAAALVCFKCLGHRNEIWGRTGVLLATTHPACARCLGDVHCPADIPAGVAGHRGKFAALVLEAATTSLLCEGALEVPGGPLDSPRDISISRKRGVDTPLELKNLGRRVLSADPI